MRQPGMNAQFVGGGVKDIDEMVAFPSRLASAATASIVDSVFPCRALRGSRRAGWCAICSRLITSDSPSRKTAAQNAALTP
jgi:hypothetical protein